MVILQLILWREGNYWSCKVNTLMNILLKGENMDTKSWELLVFLMGAILQEME